MTTDKTQNNRPDFTAFNVKKIGKKNSIWTRIGAAWKHEDGEGLSIDLDCIPLDGQIVLRTPKQDDQAQPEEN